MKTIAKRVLLTILTIVMYNSLLLADGDEPKSETGNIVKISGQVVDQITGETLAGVKLIIEGSNEVIYTDFEGEFQIQFDLNKKPELYLSMISYEGKTVKLENGESLQIKLERQK